MSLIPSGPGRRPFWRSEPARARAWQVPSWGKGGFTSLHLVGKAPDLFVQRAPVVSPDHRLDDLETAVGARQGVLQLPALGDLPVRCPGRGAQARQVHAV